MLGHTHATAATQARAVPRTLALRRALSAGVRATRRARSALPFRRDAAPLVVDIVADVDDIEGASVSASAAAWRRRLRS